MPIDKKNPGRSFQVMVTQVGPWPKGHIFSEFEFRRLHPAPKKPDGWGDDPFQTSEEYWDSLLNRLLAKQGTVDPVIKLVEEKPQPTPIGPESEPGKPFVDPLAKAIVTAIKEAGAADKAAESVAPKK